MKRGEHDLLGQYINLAQSHKRRQHCESQISKSGLSGYERLPGVLGADVAQYYGELNFQPAKLGCWLSHLKAIETSLNNSHHQHILEDDFVFTKVFKSFHDNFDSHLKSLGDWDIIFCDVDIAGMHNVSSMAALIKRVGELENSNRISFNPANPIYAAGNSSYIINKDSKHKIYSLMKNGFHSGLPNDLYLRKLIRDNKVKAFVTLPFVTTVSDDFNESTILGDISKSNPSIMFATLFRRSLAWGADTRSLLRSFQERINKLQPIGDRGIIYAQLVAHFVSKDYKNY